MNEKEAEPTAEAAQAGQVNPESEEQKAQGPSHQAPSRLEAQMPTPGSPHLPLAFHIAKDALGGGFQQHQTLTSGPELRHSLLWSL